MRGRGIDADHLALGKTLHRSAQDAFMQRQVAMGKEDQMLAEAKRLNALVRSDYFNFREVARAWVEIPGGQQALGLKTRVPMDRHQLITQTRASYSAAALPQFQPVLGRAGYTTPHLDGLLEDVSALETAITASQHAASAAKRATLERDTAVFHLRQWTGRAKRVARRALQDRPDLIAKLTL